MITETQNKDVWVYLDQGTGNSKLFLTHPVGNKLKVQQTLAKDAGGTFQQGHCQQTNKTDPMTPYITCMCVHHFLERKLPIATGTPGTRILVSSDILRSKAGGYSAEKVFRGKTMRADETGRPFYSQQLHKHPQNMNKTCTKLPLSHRLNLEPTEEEN